VHLFPTPEPAILALIDLHTFLVEPPTEIVAHDRVCGLVVGGMQPLIRRSLLPKRIDVRQFRINQSISPLIL
jgi:hypothetical protein